jgi:uncharacterized protein YciI
MRVRILDRAKLAKSATMGHCTKRGASMVLVTRRNGQFTSVGICVIIALIISGLPSASAPLATVDDAEQEENIRDMEQSEGPVSYYYFVFLYKRGAGWIDEKPVLEQPFLSDHFEYMGKLEDDGRLIIGGPFKDETGVMGVLKVGSLEEARQLIDKDPVIHNNVLQAEVKEPQSTPFRLFLRHLQPLLTPDTFNTLMIHSKPFRSQQSRNPSVPIPTVLTSQFCNPPGQPLLRYRGKWTMTISRSWLIQHPTGSSLRDAQLTTNPLNSLPSFRRADQFPEAASLRIEMSKACSATSFFRRPFSRSSSLRR